MQRIVHRDEHIDIDGNGFSATGRLELNQFLQELCLGAGVGTEYERAIASLDDLQAVIWSSAPTERTRSCAVRWNRSSSRRSSGSPTASLGMVRGNSLS